MQTATTGHRGRAKDPLYRIRTTLRPRAERLTDRQQERLTRHLGSGDPDGEVFLAWPCYQNLRSVFKMKNLPHARIRAKKIIETFHSCPVPEIARLGRTLRKWAQPFLAYFDTNRSNNGGTEAINGLIELRRRIARGFRNPINYRLRMLNRPGFNGGC